MKPELRTLIVEDVADDALLLAAELRRGGFDVTFERVETAPAMQAALEQKTWDVILCDFTLPHFSGGAALEIVKRCGGDVPFIYVSGTMGEEIAVEAMKSGAQDYVMKASLARLVPAVQRELREARIRRESQQADQAMRESEHKYRHLFETMSDAAFLIEETGDRIIDTNIQGETLLGRTRAEIIGMCQAQLYPPGQTRHPDWFPSASRSGFDLEILRKDGRPVPVHASASRIELYGRRLLLLLFRDITAIKEAQEQLHQLSQAVEQSPASIVITDPAGDIVYVNPKFTQVTGYSFAEALGKNPRILKSGETPPAEYRRLWQTITAGKVWRGEFHNKRKNGELYWEQASISPVTDAAGKITRFLAVKEDITERKHAEEALRQANRYNRSLIEASLDPLVTIGPDGKITDVNAATETATGCSRAELVGTDFCDYFTAPEKARAGYQKAFREGAVRDYDLELRHRDGRVRSVLYNASEYHDENGRVIGVFAAARDITEQRALESKFLRAQRLESIGTLAGGVAHDLNNILSPILMSISMLRAEIKSAEGVSLLTMLEDSARRGADIVKQVLTFAKGVAGQRVPLPPHQLIDEIAKIVRETFPKSISLKTHAPRNLWRVSGDVTQLHQVLLNLAVNARDAMPAGGTLQLTAENILLDAAAARMLPGLNPGPHVRFQISDTGTGIPPEIADRIFDPFFSTKGPEKGTGLGLSTVRGIVKSHGGFIQFNSPVGRGTEFEVYLPAEVTPPVEPGIESTRPFPQGQGELILVVDDEDAVRAVTRRILEANGYRTLPAVNGAEALGLYRQRRADIQLVLTDMNMPVMDGNKLTAALRKLDPNIRIVVVTGMNSETDTPPLPEPDACATLKKPCDAAQLLNTLQTILHPPPPAR